MLSFMKIQNKYSDKYFDPTGRGEDNKVIREGHFSKSLPATFCAAQTNRGKKVCLPQTISRCHFSIQIYRQNSETGPKKPL